MNSTTKVKHKVVADEIPTKENVDFNKIYVFYDLSAFSRHPNNRVLDWKHVKEFKKSMLNGAPDSLIGIIFIDINTGQIFDGQHRVEAHKGAQEEGYDRPLRVVFIDAPEDIEEQIKLINDLNNGKHWNIKDHIHSHIGGDNDLAKLQEFCLTHPRLFTECKSGKDKGKKTALMRRGAAILTGNKPYYLKALRDGTFRVSKEDWDDSEDMYNEVMDILKATRLSNQTDIPCFEGIINAWYAVRNDRRMSKKINALPHGLNDVYEFMAPSVMDLRHTTSEEEWKGRFKGAVDDAYTNYC